MDSPNVPEFTVSEIAGAVKRTLETSFGRIRIRGEITELKRYPSGHVYLSLKDEGAKIAAVVWRGAVARLGLAPENGTEVIATGRITAYGERSTYQLVIERMEFAGEGALLAAIERLRVRLAAEGLFEAGRKRTLPLLPGRIGVVTSSSGAVLHDIRTTIARRFPRELLVWPVPVQGPAAAPAIASAIERFGRLAPDGDPGRPDVLIVARGGGSLEDLMAFNDERVVRAAAACPIPLISAVGHETDTTLIDFAADRRAPTPTAAAELAVPVRSELAADLAHRAARLASGLARASHALRLRLDRAGGRLPDLPGLLDHARQRLDDRAHRLDLALPALVAIRRQALFAAARHVPDGRALLAERRARATLAFGRLGPAMAARLRAARLEAGAGASGAAGLASLLRESRARLEGMAGRLDAVSPEAVLARGYALVRDVTGRAVGRAAERPADGRMLIRFADAELAVRVDPGAGTGGQGRLDV